MDIDKEKLAQRRKEYESQYETPTRSMDYMHPQNSQVIDHCKCKKKIAIHSSSHYFCFFSFVN